MKPRRAAPPPDPIIIAIAEAIADRLAREETERLRRDSEKPDQRCQDQPTAA
jgi:hypothetical protein